MIKLSVSKPLECFTHAFASFIVRNRMSSTKVKPKLNTVFDLPLLLFAHLGYCFLWSVWNYWQCL